MSTKTGIAVKLWQKKGSQQYKTAPSRRDDAVKLLPHFADHTAGDLLSGIAGGLGTEIVRITVDHHSPANNFIHGKTIRPEG